MRLRWHRIVPAAVGAEVVPIVLLVALVAALGPGERVADQQYAEQLGRWVGPVGGALAVLLLSTWVSRDLPRDRVAHGVAVGGMTAIIDAAILVASDVAFQPLFVVSQCGRLLAGWLGGILAARGSHRSDS